MGVGGQHHAPAALLPGKTHSIGGWVGPRAGLDRPVRSKSLYRLRYSGHRSPVWEYRNFYLFVTVNDEKTVQVGAHNVCPFIEYYYMMEGCIGRNCSMHEGHNECVRRFSPKTGNQDHLRNTRIDWRIILKRNRRSKMLLCRQESLEPRLGSVTECCEHCNEILVS